MDILEETACGGEEGQQGAWLWNSYSVDPLLVPIHRTIQFSPAAFVVFQWSFDETKYRMIQRGEFKNSAEEVSLFAVHGQCIYKI